MVHLFDCSWAYVYVAYILRDVPVVRLFDHSWGTYTSLMSYEMCLWYVCLTALGVRIRRLCLTRCTCGTSV